MCGKPSADAISPLGYQVTGLDFRRYTFFYPGLEFQQADATAMPFEPGRFDAVICVSMLEYVGIRHYQDPQHDEEADSLVLGEAARVLKEKGLLVLTVPFGVAAVGSLQRTYDRARLSGILALF